MSGPLRVLGVLCVESGGTGAEAPPVKAGDVDTLRELLKNDPGLVGERIAAGSTGLHQAVRHPDALRLLIEHGADPNVRDDGDNARALHCAAAHGNLESVRILLDAGADVHGTGDLHKSDVIGWASREGNEGVIDLLLERGARHHTMLELLIELGADVEAKDDKGRTPLAVAMLRGDREAMRLLKAAGAEEPQQPYGTSFLKDMAAAGSSIKKSAPMFSVLDMRATVRWYESIGFTVDDRFEDCGELMFARLSFGNGEFTLSPGGTAGPRDVSLWFFTDRIQELYELLKERQLRVAQAALSGGSSEEPEVRFDEDLFEPFYGGRQFSIRDNNGLSLLFWQPAWLKPSSPAHARVQP